jgi:hypothetical protein
MKLSDLKAGMEVALSEDMAPYPVGVFPKGSLGTVTAVMPDAREDEPIAYVRLHQHFAALDEWENELWIWRDGDAAIADLEPLP